MKYVLASFFLMFFAFAHADDEKATEKTHQNIQKGVEEGHPAEAKRKQKKPRKDAESYQRENSQRSSWPANPSDRATRGSGPSGDPTHSDKNANE
ncbi:hypothetical protein [Bdellovibrio sp. HCB2-146]|uniref:hypothetical protein n=1 Tax=Bdellovibrio sp. HCB2-146 TaxID=3394362 RepID=UPI0039BC79C1